MLLQRKSLTSKNKKYLVIVMIFILGLFVIDLTGVGGNIYFYANWLKCGGVPYVSGSTLGGGRIPNYVDHTSVLNAMLKRRDTRRTAKAMSFRI